MHLVKNIKLTTIARNTMILLAAITLSTAVMTDALAAGRSVGGVGNHGSGRTGGKLRGPLLDRVPSMPPPVFNPSDPYTVPQPRETPVSPASPGSIFGNG